MQLSIDRPKNCLTDFMEKEKPVAINEIIGHIAVPKNVALSSFNQLLNENL